MEGIQLTKEISQLQKKLVRKLDEIWRTKVALDYENNHLWNGEGCISASLYFHLRTLGIVNDSDVRMWFEIPFPELWGDAKKHVDFVLTKVDSRIRGKDCDYYTNLEKETLVAIEVKYANTYIDSDIEKLIDIHNKLTTVVPIFAYVNYTTESGKSTKFEELYKKLEGTGIGLLFGDADDFENWESAHLEPYM